MIAVFAALALALASVGIYGVMSYAVSAQSREFGVRLALGASPRDLVLSVLGRGLRLASLGAAIGVGAAMGVGRLLGGMLYGITASDPTTYFGVCAGLLVVAVAACYVPARRMARLDPAIVLRAE
jgi:ABC-type antimicrobial peptide transport system permease subunit